MTEQSNTDQWAIVEIMGHIRTAGKISRPGDWGGLLRVDVPLDGSYRTEYYGMAAIYSVKLVSKEIAMAYANEPSPVVSYDAPIVTRAQYQTLQNEAQDQIQELHTKIYKLQHQLAGTNAPDDEDDDEPEKELADDEFASAWGNPEK
jgi:hypothetical protein